MGWRGGRGWRVQPRFALALKFSTPQYVVCPSSPPTSSSGPLGLLDWFRRSPAATPPTAPEEWQARGRLEAEVSRLSLEWIAYKDQLNRLVSRLEKRDQRARDREASEESDERAPAAAAQTDLAGVFFDPIEAERMLSQRRRNGR